MMCILRKLRFKISDKSTQIFSGLPCKANTLGADSDEQRPLSEE